MLRLLRVRAASALIAGLLCTSVGMTTLGAFGHGVDHHDGPTFVYHDASAHGFEAAPAGSGEHALHCLVCHWARSFRPSPRGVSHAAPAVEYGLRIPLNAFLVTPVALAALPPLRSPPAA